MSRQHWERPRRQSRFMTPKDSIVGVMISTEGCESIWASVNIPEKPGVV